MNHMKAELKRIEGESAEWDGEEGLSAQAGGGALVPADPLQFYISKIKKYPILSPGEERELALRYQRTGDREAAFRLVTANLMLVVKIAFEFRSSFQNMLDLIQEGNYGLMRAVRKFNPLKGARLSTYASYWIRAYMIKYLLDNWRLVRVGTTNTRRKLLYNLRALERRMKEGGIDAGPKLLAEKLGASEQDVIDVQRSLGAQDASIHQPVGDEGDRQLGEVLPASGPDVSEDVGGKQIMEKLQAAIGEFKKGLKPSDLAILEQRILSDEPVTLREIGERHGVTREAVRQAEARLLKRLKKFVKERLEAPA